ncbi:MAG: dUTP diphosphatase [Bacilli bacterium]|nr:dUTP diphosphatase [Bacilli bacterium]MDD4077215.1 dUTP diphosphatase [Bacilli bacterium]MDD4387663.1 dUTP diphosphatase [Bacilli bacterium]
MRGFEKVSLNEFIKFRTVDEYNNIYLPCRGTSTSAGYDFFIPYNIKIKPNEKKLIFTGIKAYMRPDEVLLIIIRSSIAIKQHLQLINQVAVIDSDYYNNSENEGHIMIALENAGKNEVFLKTGLRFAQGIFISYLISDNEKTPVNTRKGGLGSTEK